MRQPLKSILREIGAGKARVFSSFEDFVKVLIDDGIIKSTDELVTSNRVLLGEILFEWYIQGQVACAFAQSLAKDATRLGDASSWQTVVTDVQEDLNAIQSQLVNAADHKEAIQLIFVGPPTPEHAVEIILALCKHESWICYEKGWKEGEQGDALLIGLRWNRPDSDYASWVLGIADFAPMAFTRRFVGAPFIALVLRAGPPDELRAKIPKEGKFLASHLAHMNDQIDDDDIRKRTRHTTEYNRELLLADELRSHARAQTTFALPARCREALRGVLRPVEEA
jgi:hypothetical protein